MVTDTVKIAYILPSPLYN